MNAAGVGWERGRSEYVHECVRVHGGHVVIYYFMMHDHFLVVVDIIILYELVRANNFKI